MRYSEAPARREELLRRLSGHGYVSSSACADEFGVSEMTIRRDLRQLALEGLALRVPGGASLPGTSTGLAFEERDRSGGIEKHSIAAASLPLLQGLKTIALDAGTTVAPLARLIGAGTTVVSHSAPIIAACTQRDDIELMCIGGTYQRTTRSFAGTAAREALSNLSVDAAVLSATALDRSGLLCANTLDAEIKRAMAEIAGTRILLVDHSKLGARAPIRFGSLDTVDVVITDDGAERDDIAMLEDAGLRVIIASGPSAGLISSARP